MSKSFKTLLWAIFIIYLFVLLFVTLIYNRAAMVYSDISMWQYARRFSNLIPFKTISMYLDWISDGDRSNNSIPLINLGVNIILLVPLGYLLPSLIKIFRNLFAYFGGCIVLLAMIEFIQLLTRRGSFDIDDFILNIFGAIVAFFIWKLSTSKNVKSEKS
ncbi:MAG: VanZ family protein [Lachnospiraceae bacterium]|nr:VanZ family protein [Lachnospiraceae bacterium]